MVFSLYLASILSLGIDARQTIQREHRTYYREVHELNPILGRHPGDARILVYCGGWVAAETAVYLFAPKWASVATSVGTLAVQIPVIVNNRVNFGLAVTW